MTAMRDAMPSASSWSWSHEDKAGADPLLDADQLEPRLLAQFAVERGERFVEQQELGHLGERAGERDPLLLPAPQFVRPAPRVIRHLHQRQHLGYPCVAAAALHAFLLQPERDVAGDVEMRKQRVGLEHHVDRTPVGRHVRRVAAVDLDAPAIGQLEPGDQAQQRGLAAARRAEQREQLAMLDRQRHPIDRGHRAEFLADVADFEQRHGAARYSPALTRFQASIRARS